MISQTRDMEKKLSSLGRPREFDEADVLDNVMALFWKQGYEGTAMADILVATGLAKGSLYKAFHSKHNLYLKSLERYEAVHVDAAVIALTSNKAAMERLDNFLSAPIKDASKRGTNRGCFLCNASADKAEADAQTRALVQRGFDKMAQALTKVISDIKPDWSHAQLEQSAQMCLSVYSGLRIMSRAGVDIERLKAAKSGALLILST